MSRTIRHKQMVLFAILLVLFALALTPGCGVNHSDGLGHRECENAPDGSKITINPSSQSINTSGFGLVFDTGMDWTVRVAYPDNTPMPYACLTISGDFAVPNGYALYQFQFYPKDVSPNVAENSGYSSRTDANGQYTFSTLLSAGTGTWKDTIYVRSGSNVGSADVEVK